MFFTIIALILVILGYIDGNFWAIVAGGVIACLGVRKTVLNFDRGGATVSFGVLFGALFLSWLSYPEDTTQEPERVEQKIIRNIPNQPAPAPAIKTPKVQNNRKKEENIITEKPQPQSALVEKTTHTKPKNTPQASSSPVVYFGNPDRSVRVVYDTPEFNQRLHQEKCADHPQKIEILKQAKVILGQSVSDLDFKICLNTKPVEVPHLPEIEPDIYLVRSAYLGQYKETAKISDFVEIKKENNKTFLLPKNDAMRKANINFVFVIAESESLLATTPVALDKPNPRIVLKPQRKPTVPRQFVEKQRIKSEPVIKDLVTTIPCDTQDKFNSFVLQGGQTKRVKICVDGDQIIMKLASDNVRVNLVSGQRGIERPDDFIEIMHLRNLNKLVLGARHSLMRRQGVQSVVMDVTLH